MSHRVYQIMKMSLNSAYLSILEYISYSKVHPLSLDVKINVGKQYKLSLIIRDNQQLFILGMDLFNNQIQQINHKLQLKKYQIRQ